MPDQDPEQKLISEIVELQCRLNDIRKRKALPVEREVMNFEYLRDTMWTIAVVTLVVAIVGIAFTDPWSHGWLRTLREGIAWAFGLYYLFFGAFTITVPAMRAMSAFAHSPQKLKELPLLLRFCLPLFIAVASVVAFYYGYLGHHY